MAFSEKVLKEAFSRSGGRCECRRPSHKHGDQRCPRELSWHLHGKEPEGWQAHLLAADGPETAVNCEVLCYSCYRAVSAE